MVTRDIIVIGGSTGAVAALQRLCADLPADLQASVAIVVHVGQHGLDQLAAMLDASGPLPVVTAKDGAAIQRGRIYVAPADRHLLLLDGVARLGSGPRENMTRPAVDPLFRSAAISYGPRVIGVVLTGMLDDGAAGLAAVKQCGGVAMVQNPSDAEAAGMPNAALRACAVDYRTSVADLGRQLALLTREAAGPAGPPPPEIALEVDIAWGDTADSRVVRRIADPSTLSCPSCDGVLSEIKSRPPLRFRCQVGHAFTAESLEHEQGHASDAALRVALRILDQRASLTERMVEDARASGRNQTTALFEERAQEYRAQAETIRQSLLRPWTQPA